MAVNSLTVSQEFYTLFGGNQEFMDEEHCALFT